MTEVVVFHHAQGLTAGVREFADQLRAAGHRVTAPDLYDGATFDSLPDGIAHAERIGFDTVVDRGRAAAERLPAESVYVGFSLGVLPAQMLAQTRSGSRGAVLCHSCLPISEFGDWPPGLAAQVHGMDADEIFACEGDLDAARELVEVVERAELFLYPGDRHLFADAGLPSYDVSAATLLTRRVIDFLDHLG
jgi:dienelactone hydrolase